MTENLKEQIIAALKEKRSKLGINSIKTYTSCLLSIYKKLNGDDGVKFFTKNVKEILDLFKDTPSNKRKTSLSALFIISNDEEYKTQMLTDCKAVNDLSKEQKKSKNETINWITYPEIQEKYSELLSEIGLMFNNKALLEPKKIIQFLILSLMSGVAGISPRRSLDYAEMKIRNFDKETDNYYSNGKMVFNKYKTFKVYGRSVVDVKTKSPLLNSIIKKWIKINQNDYLLFGDTNKQLSVSQLTKINNNIWGGKKVSCDLYRHIFLTNFYSGTMPTLADMDALSKEMGHSISTALQYIKH